MTKKSASPRTTAEQIWETRTQLVKKELAAESAANDAKTARLRALRLAKEAEEAAAQSDTPAPESAPAKKRVRRIVVS